METFGYLREGLPYVEKYPPCYGDSKLPHEVLDDAIDKLKDIAMSKMGDGWFAPHITIFNFWSSHLWTFNYGSEDVEYCLTYDTNTDSWECRVDGKRAWRGNGIQEYIKKCKGGF